MLTTHPGYRCTRCARSVAPRVPNETRAVRDRMRKRQLCPGCYYALFPCDHCAEQGPCLRCQVMFTRRQWRDNARYRVQVEARRRHVKTVHAARQRHVKTVHAARQRQVRQVVDAARELA